MAIRIFCMRDCPRAEASFGGRQRSLISGGGRHSFVDLVLRPQYASMSLTASSWVNWAHLTYMSMGIGARSRHMSTISGGRLSMHRRRFPT